MKPYRLGISVLVCSLLTLFLSACGGGGGSGVSEPASVTYTANASAAIISATNASDITANVTGSSDVTGSGELPAIIAGVSVAESEAARQPGNGIANVAFRINVILSSTDLPRRQASGAGPMASGVVQVDQTEACDSGQMHLVGTLNDAGTGALTLSYNDCRMGDDTLSGQATLRVDAFDLSLSLPTDSTFSFPRLSLRGPGVNGDVGGSLRSQLTIASNTERLTTNITTIDNVTGRQAKAENLVSVYVYDNIFTPSSFTQTITGRVYHGVHGYVDIATTKVLMFGTLVQPYPDSGEILLTGAGNRSIRVTAVSATVVKLALDLDGNGVSEKAAMLKWVDLSEAIGSNLADNDADTMHNSWETAFGLNPDDPSDAAIDSDGDGVNNLDEYQAGTDPQNAASS